MKQSFFLFGGLAKALSVPCSLSLPIVAFALGCVASAVLAQPAATAPVTQPGGKLVRIQNGFPPGGSADVLTRLIAAGAAATTLKADLIASLATDPVTETAMAQFAQDVQASQSAAAPG